MIFRIYPSKDTFISNDFGPYGRVRLTGANVGASEDLVVFKRAGISGAIGTNGSSSLARSLLHFDLSQLCEMTASGQIPSSGLSFRLHMNHKTTACVRPTSFDLVVRPLSSSWDEGLGQDVLLGDKGFSNWDRRTSTSFWNTPGGDFINSLASSAHFDSGDEDLDVDITQIVQTWLSGSAPNNGIAVSMTSSIESDSLYLDYYQKKFYSRHSFYRDRIPYIEVRANDSIRDDRTNMQWGRSGTLYLYNIVGGEFESLSADPVVSISDLSGVIAYKTASHGVYPGVYSASFLFPTGTYAGRPYSGSVFFDSWTIGSDSVMNSSFIVNRGGGSSTITQHPLTARIRNMRDEYTGDDVEVFEVLFRRQAHTIPVLQTASLGVVPYIVEKAYYAVENDSTRERVIPFGTGSQQHTRLSYGASGNSFKLYMRNLHAGNVYRIIFLTVEQGRNQVIDSGIKFKVI